ncbi:MAG TPA: biotin--[acetyl-CoA-carboxylase] ligase [Rhodanobacteraceae bacterium]|nr:biotin--[acetyl-CoA-carboxylase] ligase [Rhodanobacteraceae bacterium]
MLAQDLARCLADGAAHSGAALAARFGVTRAAVWKHVEELRSAGLPVAAAAGQGYRLARPFEPLDAARIRAELAPGWRARLAGLQVAWELDSTSSALLRAGAAGAAAPAVCLAERQSGGRGRRGRQWQSPLGNVYFSLLWRFDAGMAALSGLSLAVGVAVVQALGDVGASGLGLKWPNDVLRDGAKLAGVLVELGGEFLGPCHAVIGIGINLVAPPVPDQPVTALAAQGLQPSRNVLVARLVERLGAVLERFASGGFAAVHADYAALDLLRDRALRVSDARGQREGVGAGVDARGALLVREGADLVRYDSAEVTVRAA